MKFLPDSAVLGTLGRIKHATKPRHRKGSTVSDSVKVIAQSWESFRVDTRTLEELLAEAKSKKEKQHAE